MHFINIRRRNYTRSYDIQNFSQPAVSSGISVGQKVFVSGYYSGILHVDE